MVGENKISKYYEYNVGKNLQNMKANYRTKEILKEPVKSKRFVPL